MGDHEGRRKGSKEGNDERRERGNKEIIKGERGKDRENRKAKGAKEGGTLRQGKGG